MDLTTSLEHGQTTVLRVKGEIDLATAEQFRASIGEALSEHSPVVVDMADVTFIDASGLRVILQAAESANGHGPLKITNAARVKRLFDLVGLTEVPSLQLRESD
jgi:anti-anti-sigma factor